MKTYHFYKSYYFDKNLNNIDPFYIIHKAENLKKANDDAKRYYISYTGEKYFRKGADFINKIQNQKNFKVKTVKLKKL